jgi:hypothetical protein
MKSLKPYLKPFLIIGVFLVATFLVSWFAFPDWRAQPSGIWTLFGVAAVGVAAIIKDALVIAKTVKELREPPKQGPSLGAAQPYQVQNVRGSKNVEQSGRAGATR